MRIRIRKWAICILLLVVAIGLVSHFASALKARRSPMWQYAARALAKNAPDYDLRNCVDLDAKDRRDFSNTNWKPLPCINTATSNYNPDYRAGNCAKFVREPARWSFRKVGRYLGETI